MNLGNVQIGKRFKKDVMIKVNEGHCEVKGDAVTLMSELTIIMTNLRETDSDVFDDDCFNRCIELSSMSEVEIREHAIK